MHQVTVLQVQAVAAGGVAMGDQHTVGRAGVDDDIGLDVVAARAHIGRHVGGQMAHARMKHKVPPVC